MIVKCIGTIVVIAGLISLCMEKCSPGKSCGGWIIVIGMAIICSYNNAIDGSLLGTILFVFIGLWSVAECVDNYKRKKQPEEDRTEMQEFKEYILGKRRNHSPKLSDAFVRKENEQKTNGQTKER